MKRFGSWLVVAAVVAVAIPVLWAQQDQPPRRGGGFGGGLAFLAGQKSVQEELKMTDDQVAKVKEFAEKQREGRRGGGGGGKGNFNPEELQKRMQERAKAEAKALADILKPDQLKRLKQISWQQQGTRVLGNEEVADALKLSGEQKDKIKTIQEDSRKEMRDLFGGGNREEARKKMEELRKATDEKVTAVLTAEQKTKLKDLTGEPFKGTIERPQFNPGGGRRGRPGGDQPKKDTPKKETKKEESRKG
jgi:Spy/CpxP family protein refolding chaperone